VIRHSVQAQDDSLLVAGTALFDRGHRSLGHRFMEHYTLSDGVVTERRSFLDAVPVEVEEFFAA
jgi:hypothetical protein